MYASRILARVEVFEWSSVQLPMRIPSFSAQYPRQTRCQSWDMWPRVANSPIRFETLYRYYSYYDWLSKLFFFLDCSSLLQPSVVQWRSKVLFWGSLHGFAPLGQSGKLILEIVECCILILKISPCTNLTRLWSRIVAILFLWRCITDLKLTEWRLFWR